MRARFRHLRFLSVRNRILLFALLVTLVPSIGLGWVFFKKTEQALLESSQRELTGAISQVGGELELWFRERYHDIRVFSNSSALFENLEGFLDERSLSAVPGAPAQDPHLKRLESYLSIVLAQLSDYEGLLVFDREGGLLSRVPQRTTPVELPLDWREQLEANEIVVGDVHRSEIGSPLMLVAVPILSGQDDDLGLLAAEIRLDALAAVMRSSLLSKELPGTSTELSLVGTEGQILLSTRRPSTTARGAHFSSDLTPLELAEYVNVEGVPVVGVMAPVADHAWRLVIEKPVEELFAEVIQVRNRTLLGVGVLVSLIGLFAYSIARGIVSPLERLTEAAGKVADGDLDVKIPVTSRDELGKTTQVFNEMVDQLRQSRDRLRQLSTIDSLTQLANRKHVVEKLATHLERFRRHGTPFSILLLDVDRFKAINDSLGHVAGDKVLADLGSILTRLLRAVDIAGRYGGEEFLIILDETRGSEALQTAERIRLTIEAARVNAAETPVTFTVSIGVAEVGVGEDEDSLIMRADAALYQAKNEGRNHSVLADPREIKVTQHPSVRKRKPS